MFEKLYDFWNVWYMLLLKVWVFFWVAVSFFFSYLACWFVLLLFFSVFCRVVILCWLDGRWMIRVLLCKFLIVVIGVFIGMVVVFWVYEMMLKVISVSSSVNLESIVKCLMLKKYYLLDKIEFFCLSNCIKWLILWI